MAKQAQKIRLQSSKLALFNGTAATKALDDRHRRVLHRFKRVRVLDERQVLREFLSLSLTQLDSEASLCLVCSFPSDARVALLVQSLEVDA